MKMKNQVVLGIDIGGSGIKGAPVDISTGEFLAERHRIETPTPATPEAIAQVIKQLAEHFNWTGSIGCGFPAVVQNGLVYTASNIDASWININAKKLFSKVTGLKVTVINDADAAGLAEMKFGAGKKNKDFVLIITVGTGIGTAIFTRRKLLPNTELGHIQLHGDSAERYASDATRKKDELEWESWAGRFNEYLAALEKLFYPDLIILGGGLSKKPEKFLHLLTPRTPIVTARLQNNAGIVGAALAVK
jgi:polyphosphate glucokinase